METTTTVNGKAVQWSLSAMETGAKVSADLISRGFDGSYYLGESVPSGKQKQRTALFLRAPHGFVVAS